MCRIFRHADLDHVMFFWLTQIQLAQWLALHLGWQETGVTIRVHPPSPRA
jgi:hypothetical protein